MCHHESQLLLLVRINKDRAMDTTTVVISCMFIPFLLTKKEANLSVLFWSSTESGADSVGGKGEEFLSTYFVDKNSRVHAPKYFTIYLFA